MTGRNATAVPCRSLIGAGIVVIALFATYAHVFSLFDEAGRTFLPPFRPSIPRVSTFTNFGTENRTLGEHIAEGKGFTDPFAIGTGDTAWMSPVYPVIVAGLMKLFGPDVEPAGVAMAVGQALGLMFIWWAVVTTIRPQSRVEQVGLFAVLALFLLTHFEYSFLFTHDNFLGAIGLAALIRSAPAVSPPQSRNGWARWGLIGGLATFAMPALAVPWGLISLPSLRRNGRGMLTAGMMFALVLTPWTIRNAIVFGEFIPVKSNAAYELYQTLRYSDNGLVTPDVLDHHPGRNDAEGQEYRELGESAFVSRKAEQAKELLRNDPDRYLRQCGYRLWTMFVWEDDFYRDPMWPVPYGFCRIVYLLPVLGLLVIIGSHQWRRDPAALTAALALIGLAIPYVLMSYYERYEYAFGPAKMVLTFFALQAMVRQRDRRHGAASQVGRLPDVPV